MQGPEISWALEFQGPPVVGQLGACAESVELGLEQASGSLSVGALAEAAELGLPQAWGSWSVGALAEAALEEQQPARR